MLTLVKSVPGPSVSMWLIAVSTVMYIRLQRSFGIPSLILGCKRSTMNLYFCKYFLGITPHQLMCAFPLGSLSKGPDMRD